MQSWSCLHDWLNLQPIEQLKNLHLGRPEGFMSESLAHSACGTLGKESARELGEPLAILALTGLSPGVGLDLLSRASSWDNSSNFLLTFSLLSLLFDGELVTSS